MNIKPPNLSRSKTTALIFLVVILLIASFFRFYQLDKSPPSLSWDEAAVGYNAWSVANYGIDEWGKTLPVTFTSFEDDKHPIHIYLTALSVKIFGLSEFSTRLPMAILGVVIVLLIYLLGVELFGSQILGLTAAFLIAISPYNLQFSRFNHELNVAIFFFLLSVWLFFRGFRTKKWYFAASFFFFGVTLLCYHSAKIVVPPLVALLVALYFEHVRKIRKLFLIGIAIFALFIILIVSHPALLGIARVKQTNFLREDLEKTTSYQQSSNIYLAELELVTKQYFSHFSPQYLFVSGSNNFRFSTQKIGEFYYLEAFLLIVGAISLVMKRSRIALFLLAWALIAPLPSSLVREAPHSARAMFMIGSWHLISAFGAYTIYIWLRFRHLSVSFLLISVLAIGWQFIPYIHYYFEEYPSKYAIEWQYGMKEIALFAKEHPEYGWYFMTPDRSQPYIFFLYYLQTNPRVLQKTVTYDQTIARSYNLVSSFDKYMFGGWDWVESRPNPGVVYILTPAQYSGLRFRDSFKVKKLIKYPNGGDAFFIVSVY